MISRLVFLCLERRISPDARGHEGQCVFPGGTKCLEKNRLLADFLFDYAITPICSLLEHFHSLRR